MCDYVIVFGMGCFNFPKFLTRRAIAAFKKSVVDNVRLALAAYVIFRFEDHMNC